MICDTAKEYKLYEDSEAMEFQIFGECELNKVGEGMRNRSGRLRSAYLIIQN